MIRTHKLSTACALLCSALAPFSSALQIITAPDRTRLLQERPQRIQAAKNVLNAQRTLLGLTSDDTFEPTASSYDDLGRLHVRFTRFYKGVRVMGGDLKVGVAPEGSGGRVDTRPAPTAAMPSVQPAISQKEMGRILASELRAGDSELEIVSELVLDDSGKQPVLAWLARVDGDRFQPTNYLVDARSGAVLESWPAITEALNPEQTTAQTTRYDEIDIDHVRNTVADRYELQDATRGFTRVYDMQDKKPTSTFKGALYVQDPADPSPTTWGDGQDWTFGDSTSGPRGQTAAVEAYYNGRLTWDLYKNVFGRDGLDDAGSAMKLRVHIRKKSDEHYGDAYWDGTYASFGDGTESDHASRTDTITVGHELGHGLWGAAVTSDNKGGERRGLNEGHGDIQGTIVNHYRALAGGTGNTVPSSDPGDVSLFYGRDINPWGYSTGGEIGLPYYVDGMGDHEEHIQGTAYARMFATLAAGAPSVEEYENGPACEPNSGYKAFGCLVSPLLPQGLAGIGIHKAARIWYLATTAYLDGKPTFAETRDAYLQAADDLYGLNSPEYKSTMNAWRAINVGSEATDTAAPTVVIGGPLLNNYEQSLVVSTVGQDDIGVDHIDFFRNAILENSVHGGVWLGLLDLSKVGFGNYSLKAVAYDRLGKTGSDEKPLAYQGANYLLKNRGFEQGTDSWNLSGGVAVKSSASHAFLGPGYAEFSTTGDIRQKFSVPNSIIGLKVGYRISVDPEAGPVDSFEQLDIELLQGNGVLMQTLDTIHANLNTSNSVYRDYKQFNHSLPLDYAGRDYILKFRATTPRVGRFRIDNVYVAYEGVPDADLIVDVDEAEGSVTFQVKNITGIELSQIKEIRVAQPGTEGTRLGTQLMAVLPTSEFKVNTDYQVVAKIIDVLGNEVANIGPVHFQVKPVNQLIVNMGFEGGNGWWDTGGGAEVVHYNPAWGDGNAAFLGDNWARLGGQGIVNTATLRQNVDIPKGVSNVKLTFRVRVDSGEIIGVDALNVNVLEFGTYQKLETLKTILSDTDTNTADNYHGQQKFNGFDLTAYKGKTIILEFQAQEDSGLATTFHIDNVGVTYTTLGLAP
ncbi:M4 family metallopeptidase [uncultured Paludibaculum sp.]|uniref:M4 family metallopeptidase n=1 Tax=uncultured Paludibaculum sp. TaxID=1765020 RepID=UPI002AAA7A6B|nr:M4 family metallopeptidase [uncultured Paludibaculum sp.]